MIEVEKRTTRTEENPIKVNQVVIEIETIVILDLTEKNTISMIGTINMIETATTIVLITIIVEKLIEEAVTAGVLHVVSTKKMLIRRAKKKLIKIKKNGRKTTKKRQKRAPSPSRRKISIRSEQKNWNRNVIGEIGSVMSHDFIFY